ncbi:MAG: hypothetical protein QOI68_2751, partial [Pseudonocardiales bacterium]|nr:hypothetical protein [Pseudonocardiales bacterium]
MSTRAYAHSEWQPEYWLSIGRTARLRRRDRAHPKGPNVGLVTR